MIERPSYLFEFNSERVDEREASKEVSRPFARDHAIVLPLQWTFQRLI